MKIYPNIGAENNTNKQPYNIEHNTEYKYTGNSNMQKMQVF